MTARNRVPKILAVHAETKNYISKKRPIIDSAHLKYPGHCSFVAAKNSLTSALRRAVSDFATVQEQY